MKNQFSEIFLSKGVNYLLDDAPLINIIKFLDIKYDSDLANLGLFVSNEVVESADFIDHEAKPVLRTWSVLGKRIDYVRISPDHRNLLNKLLAFGIVRKSIESDFPLTYHFLSGYLISDSGLFCTLTLTAQTAYAISKYGDQNLKGIYLKNYLSLDDPWLGATYYSETQGGSDLGANNTTATENGDLWTISGIDKYFASDAGLADGAIVTAKVVEGYGAKNLAVFFVPAYKDNGDLNYKIRRLKDKLGTIAVPTGEVEFDNSEGFLIGDKKNGVYYAMEILTISRIDDAIAAVGIARKALWEAYLFANRREAFGKKIIDHPLLLRDFLENEAELEAAIFLSVFAADKFSKSSKSEPPYSNDYNYARLLSHIAKNMASWTSGEVTRYSMEIFGGIGFFEEFPVAKFHRDAIVTSIWEGTSNIQALDMLEAIQKKKAHILFLEEFDKLTSAFPDQKVKSMLNKEREKIVLLLNSMLNLGTGELFAKDLLSKLGEYASTVLLYSVGFNAQNQKDKNSILNSANIYFWRHFRKNDIMPEEFISGDKSENLKWMLKIQQ